MSPSSGARASTSGTAALTADLIRNGFFYWLQGSAQFKRWKADNPAEVVRLETALLGDDPGTMTTANGRAYVSNIRAYASAGGRFPLTWPTYPDNTLPFLPI